MNIPMIIKQFLNSEKAVASGLAVIAATVFVFLGKISAQEWMSYSQVVLGIYVGGKSVQGAVTALALKNATLSNDAVADKEAKKKK